MAERTDILLRGDDLAISNGDFEIGVSDPQNVYLILMLPPGSWKQYPLTGVGKQIINGTLDGGLRRNIQLQLEGDGYRLKALDLNSDGNIDIQFDTK